MPVPNNLVPEDADEGIDYSDIYAKYQVKFEDGFDNILVVDGVPVIEETKIEKLLAKVAKEFNRKGSAIRPDDIYVPLTESKMTKGYMFVEFRTADEANLALAKMHGHRFDSKHTFSVNLMTDIERFASMDETYTEPEPEEYKPRAHLRAWLGDVHGRDQYATYQGDETVVHWHGKASQCEIAHKKPEGSPPWTELYVAWSPLGTYLATLHQQGVRLWGGPTFEPQQRFRHPRTRLLDFSPCERYLVTWSHEPIVVRENDPRGPDQFSDEDEGNNIAVWDLETGHLLRTFPGLQDDSEDRATQKQMSWPALKWSLDGQYVARVTPGQHISVYELPSMGLHGKKSIKIEGVVDFEWCPLGDSDRAESGADVGKAKGTAKPKENLLAYWTPEAANQPARVTLMGFPSRAVLRQKNLFNVADCTLYWHNQGDFLCVKVDRHTKTKKTVFCNLEIFRIRDKDFPVEVIEMKESVTQFSWEPNGERFIIISTNDPNVGNPAPAAAVRTEVSIYQLHRAKGDFTLYKTIASSTHNSICWSPRGRFVVLANVGSTTKSEFQFWDLDFDADDTGRKDAPKGEWGTGVQQIGVGDHYGVTDLAWDPSGRYLATSASAWKHRLENGYAIWNFRGQEVEKHVLDHFKQFLWRPRPRTLLSKSQQREIRKKFREYGKVFDEEDAADASNVSAELITQRKRLVDEWNAWRMRCKRELGADAVKRLDQKAEQSTAKEEIEVWVEELVEEIFEVIEDE